MIASHNGDKNMLQFLRTFSSSIIDCVMAQQYYYCIADAGNLDRVDMECLFQMLSKLPLSPEIGNKTYLKKLNKYKNLIS